MPLNNRLRLKSFCLAKIQPKFIETKALSIIPNAADIKPAFTLFRIISKEINVF